MTILKQVELWEAIGESHRDVMRRDLTTDDDTIQERLARAADEVVEALRQYAAELPESFPAPACGLSEQEETERGQMLIDVFCLRRVSGKRGHYHTQWGSKTPLGMFRTIKRIVEEGE